MLNYTNTNDSEICKIKMNNDFNFSKANKYYSHHATCDIETHERVLTGIDYFFIELPKFKKEIIELVELRTSGYILLNF